MQTKANSTLINRKTLLKMIPLSARTIYNLELRGEFPRRIALTSRNVAWQLSEVEQWIADRKSAMFKAARPGIVLGR
ncbi:AlpA family phage regulatory protein [Pectobacterium versatile]|jgi:prophage regulatory protein|uniref:helix-turn-helix transcriptional regulator n=1 Tax=Pectobacterium versatile TaxID=2488639 RepID=UPI00202D62B9|nr:AlpA family phage regulatory protein [Pectobacterium carotovorum]MCL6334937.1 AlpA family phage regulatory protein [Pectobacterium carotovorum subsp. carotovorum]MCL6347956.1 AlpA family phage regulatory protein [Pectobacterium carotovorum subsp. carotovorum]MCL6402690.1 AlpA family phage regulatory protein [Pectobacterium carotovorum subsp. carotovorum]